MVTPNSAAPDCTRSASSVAETSQNRRHAAHCDRRQAADRDVFDRSPCACLQIIDGGAKVLENLASSWQQRHPRRRQRHVPRGAQEQGNGKRILQLADAMAQCRL
jgi:hypothetical protein